MSEEIFELSTEDGDDDALNLPGLASDGVPGLLVSVEFDDNLSAPIIENGKVRMPRSGGSAPLAQFKKNADGSTSVTAGLLAGIEFSTGVTEPMAQSGLVYFPLARAGGYFDSTPVAGALIGCEYSSSVTYPVIDNGVLLLPESGEGTTQLVEFSSSVTVPGLLKGCKFVGGVTEPEAASGVMLLPLAYFISGVYNVAGGIKGVCYRTDISEPTIDQGVLNLLASTDSLLQGVVQANGSFATWREIQAAAGAEVVVATTMLQANENTTIPISLSVGFNGKGLTFNLYNA